MVRSRRNMYSLWNGHGHAPCRQIDMDFRLFRGKIFPLSFLSGSKHRLDETGVIKAAPARRRARASWGSRLGVILASRKKGSGLGKPEIEPGVISQPQRSKGGEGQNPDFTAFSRWKVSLHGVPAVRGGQFERFGKDPLPSFINNPFKNRKRSKAVRSVKVPSFAL